MRKKSDAILSNNVFLVRGSRNGSTVALVAGVHGNEIAPILALRAWQKSANRKQIHGSVYVVFGNPEAISKRMRYIDENMNRSFGHSGQRRTVEARRVRELEPILEKCSAVLDLHASNSKGTKPFVITEARGMKIGQWLPVKFIVHGFTKYEPGSVDEFTDNHGGTGLCVECGFLGAKSSQKVAQQAIREFLKATGSLLGRGRRRSQRRYRICQLYFNKNKTFVPIREWDDFSPVEAGQVIGVDGSTPVAARKSGRLLFVRQRQGSNKECFILLQPICAPGQHHHAQARCN